MKYLLLMMLSFPVYAETTLFVGLGVHPEKYDCPEVCFGGDSLAIVELKYKPTNYLAVKAVHISNPEIFEKGYGMNAVFLGFDIKL